MTTFGKTESGLLSIRGRQETRLSRRQRLALILFDGQRSVQDVMAMTAAVGVTPEASQAPVQMELIAAPPPAPPSRSDHRADPRVPPGKEEAERVRCYRVAYPIAVGLTSKLGLRGFRLNLKVEAAQGYQGLVELLPAMRDTFSNEELRPLLSALRWR
jgi:hypothetical protein